jgi:phospholipid transport system substrate-binding protein
MMLTRRLFIACATLLAFAGWVAPTTMAHADARSEAAATFIRDLGARSIDVLIKEELPRSEVNRRFRLLLNEGFDVPYIARFVLARNWQAANPAQQKEYMELFEKLIVQVYADRFAQYAGKNIDINKSLKILGHRPEGDSDAIVSTQIIRPDAPPVAVDWRVRQRGSNFKIIDIAVEGVSMSVTQRSEFASVIQRGGGQMEALLQALRQRVASAS